ncbi:MAG: BTAD domain-containing putative transcriptional regulator [Granulosicoccus sp.]
MTSFFSGAVIGAQANNVFLRDAVTANAGPVAKDWAMIAAQEAPLRKVFDGPRILDVSLLENANISDKDLQESLEAALPVDPPPPVLLVDMASVLNAPVGARAIETWSHAAQRIVDEYQIKLISIYDQEKMIEEDLAAALRSHQHMLVPSGLYPNPFWLPEELAKQGSTDDHIRYYLSKIAPDYAAHSILESRLPSAARGATPDWIKPAPYDLGAAGQSERWQIHCLGELQVDIGGGGPVNWRVSGASPIKTQLLFAYLLTRGARPTHADTIAEVVWLDNRSEEDKRKRLHHTISTLRKVLGGKDTIRRSGAQYALNIPPGSWIDMDRFEQLCRRGLALLTAENLDAAYKVYAAADLLYRGDLFEGLPIDGLDYELEDWCVSRRTWLNSMAAKLNYDMSKVLRRTGRLNEALLHCQKALTFDPTDENGNLEMVRVLLAQGRLDAVARHVSQFEKVSRSNGIPIRASKFFEEYQRIISQ